MATQAQKGNCYLCGAELGKVAMKNHIFKLHDDPDQAQECALIKAEGMDKNYWLYFDAPTGTTLKNVDAFLRKIWLECCGHMSAFMGPDYQEYPMSRKLDHFPVGSKIAYEYDFGSTTRLLITFVGITHRPRQKEVVRLLARNVPFEWKCGKCAKPAAYIAPELMYTGKDPFFCEDCLDGYDTEFLLPVTNSPRMGVCGYEGMLDRYAFDPTKFKRGVAR